MRAESSRKCASYANVETQGCRSEDVSSLQTQRFPVCVENSEAKLYYKELRIRASPRRFLLWKALLFVPMLSSCGSGLAYYHENPSSRFHYPNGNNGIFKFSRSTVGMRMSLSDSDSLDFEDADEDESSNSKDVNDEVSRLERKLMKRVTSLEALVAKQEVEIHRLKKAYKELSDSSETFARIIQMLREAGFEAEGEGPSEKQAQEKSKSPDQSSDNSPGTIIESFDESAIFGSAPSSVIDAADGAGAAILAAMLGGKQRMYVDVRDAELSSDPEMLVQFIELAILPIAAGLEGLKSTRNRVKIVFPKVSQLLEYRRTMALAAPEVVALSTLGFDPVEKRDKLVVVVAPEPDDEEGLEAMKDLLMPSSPDTQPIQQPVVLLNYHMVPVANLPIDFETAYHLRLLSVQYMSSGHANDYFQQFRNEPNQEQISSIDQDEGLSSDEEVAEDDLAEDDEELQLEDEELEAAMQHASEVGMNQGITRAMVIRAYPRYVS